MCKYILFKYPIQFYLVVVGFGKQATAARATTRAAWLWRLEMSELKKSRNYTSSSESESIRLAGESSSMSGGAAASSK